MEQIMCDLGYRNIGFPCLVCSNKILGFVITLLSMIKVCFKLRSGDILIIQYPLKKYYTLLCNPQIRNLTFQRPSCVYTSSHY